MPTPQPGMFALGTRSHHHLELDVVARAGDSDLARSIARVRALMVTSSGVNLVIGFGSSLWRRLAPDQAPASLSSFEDVRGLDGKGAPSTQRDIWVWAHGSDDGAVGDVVRSVARRLRDVAEVRLDQPCSVYRGGRDLTGFLDGTANPPVAELAEVALVPPGRVGAGGSFVMAQRWVHALEEFASLPLVDQEQVIGRTKSESLELQGDAKPPDAHISRVEISDATGRERPIFRRSTPFGGVGEAGLYFLAFSADPDRYGAMLSRMFGVAGDGIQDRLTDFSTPVTGSYFFAPCLEALGL